MAATNIVRRTERSGTSAQAASAALMEGELGYISDLKKLIVGDGAKQGGYTLTPDNIVAIWPDQSNANSPLSLAWWIARAGGTAIKLRLPAGTYNVLDDLTVPSNIYLEADKGAVLNVSAGKTLTLNCEVGADAQLAFSGEGTAVENYVRRLFVNENLISHRQHLWHSSKRDESTGEVRTDYTAYRYALYSDLFALEPLTQYTIKSYAGCRGELLFFDSDQNYLAYGSTVSAGGGVLTFTTPANTAYCGINSYLPDPDNTGQYLRTSIRDLGWKHLYKLEKGPIATAFSIALRDMQDPASVTPDDRPKNNPEAARQLVSCAESYIHPDQWVYSNSFHLTDDNTTAGPPRDDLFELAGGVSKARIDCSTLIRLAVNGIPYFQSKYVNANYPWRGVKYYEWAKCPKFSLLADFAYWCFKNGWEIDPGINYGNLQAGDLVFWGGNPAKETYETFTVGGFRSIDHVGMYTGRWMADPNRDNELHPQTIEVQMGSPVVVNRFVDEDYDDTALTSHSTQYIQMIARIPLESPYTEYDSEQTLNNVLYSSYYKPSVLAIGNGQPLKIDIYGRNGAKWTIGGVNAENGSLSATEYRIRSNYIPYGWNYKNTAALTAAGFVNQAWHYYNADFVWLGATDPGGNAKYVVLVFKKADNSLISSNDLKQFEQITAAQKIGRDTITGGKYPSGFHSYVYLATTIPSGARLDRRNGKYAYTTDGITWTELPEADQTKLFALRIGDGENNIYIPHGQHVKLMRQAMD